jgi:hypothetical protein
MNLSIPGRRLWSQIPSLRRGAARDDHGCGGAESQIAPFIEPFAVSILGDAHEEAPVALADMP